MVQFALGFGRGLRLIALGTLQLNTSVVLLFYSFSFLRNNFHLLILRFDFYDALNITEISKVQMDSCV
jgi:uncharacterized membrane protein